MIWDDHEEIVKECETWCKLNNKEAPVMLHDSNREYADSYAGIPTNLKNNTKLFKLKTWMEKCVYTAAEEVNRHHWKSLKNQPKVIITDLWAWSSTEYYNHYHGHPNSSWSGIYYLDVNSAHKQGHTQFYSPLPFNHYSDAGTLFVDAESSISYEPRDGMLIIFPSYIRHEGMPYKSDKRRTLIAFNTQIN
jgi:uncharacterized protein (TIGR02466 family)